MNYKSFYLLPQEVRELFVHNNVVSTNNNTQDNVTKFEIKLFISERLHKLVSWTFVAFFPGDWSGSVKNINVLDVAG
jgi:hypothetical protein